MWYVQSIGNFAIVCFINLMFLVFYVYDNQESAPKWKVAEMETVIESLGIL